MGILKGERDKDDFRILEGGIKDRRLEFLENFWTLIYQGYFRKRGFCHLDLGECLG